MEINHPIIFKSASVLASTLIFLCFGSALTAQTGAEKVLIVNVGDEIEFESTTTIVGTGGKIHREQTTHGMDVLKVDSISDDRIYWTMKAIMNIEESKGKAEVQESSGVVPVAMDIITDKSGHVVSMSMSNENVGLGQGDLFSIGGAGKSGQALKGPGWFLPEELHSKKIGESWEQTTLDTVTVNVVNAEVTMIVGVTVTYTFTGTVDTLGTRVAGVQWEYEDFTMNAEFEVPNSEVTMSINGKGSGTGMTYYSVHDKILSYQSSEMEMEQTVDMGKMGKQEVVVQMSTEQTRVE